MASLRMVGPYPLTKEEVLKRVPEGSIGNYAFGEVHDNLFRVMDVGRSDVDLRQTILDALSCPVAYPYFKFSIAESPVEAFNKECQNWHDFRGDEGRLSSTSHPISPKGHGCLCPYCHKSFIDS